MLSFVRDILGIDHQPEERSAHASQLAERCGYAAAALTILPIPGSEILGVMPIHVGMVVGIGHIYGEEITEESATELILKIGATVGLSIVGSRVAMTAAKLVLPGLGGLVAAPFMFASTLAIGAVAKAYFATDGDLSDEEIKRVYEDQKSRAKKDFDPSKAKSESAKSAAQEAKASEDADKATASPPTSANDPTERLRKLKGMLDEGLIEQSEYDETKQRILADL